MNCPPPCNTREAEEHIVACPVGMMLRKHGDVFGWLFHDFAQIIGDSSEAYKIWHKVFGTEKLDK